jgi:FtsH-binding integral membrane protein
MVLACAAGARLSLSVPGAGALVLFARVASFALLVPIFVPGLVSSFRVRVGAALAFGGVCGVSVAPLVRAALRVDPAVVGLALVATCVVFACFSVAALLARRRAMLFLGAFLFSALSLLVMAGFLNRVFLMHSSLVFGVELYGGLMVFCGFVAFDTQMIIERASNGDLDPVRHAIDLFLDLLNIFIRVLIILTKKNKPKSKK